MYTISGIILDVKKKEAMKGGERITVLGSVLFDGTDITLMKPSERAKKGIVLCPERRRIFPESSTLENLKIGGYLATKAQAKKTLEYVFTIFPPLKNLKGREGGFLSGGTADAGHRKRPLMANRNSFSSMNLCSD
jgi:branched-chain amino acid transport system ATP-binding protein